jgi:polyferredoxin
MRGRREYMKAVRRGVQLFFLLFSVFIGYRFHQFVLHFEDPTLPFVPRPTSVDAFLPISGLMSLKYFVWSGTVEPMHPAAMVIFAAVLLVALFLRKGFCGWMCPVGLISESLAKGFRRLTGRDPRMPLAPDIGLRFIKYFLMALFLLLIGVALTPNMMVLFFITDYYKAVDVRMLRFFTDMSLLTLVVLLALGALSLIYKGFWCRYLCPYGALLGLLGRLGPLAVRRDPEKCIGCHSCTRTCPSLIRVEEKESVKSAECIGCLSCVSGCPAEGALEVGVKAGGRVRALRPWLYPVALLALFYAVMGLGMATGNWHSQLPYQEYRRIIPALSGHESPPPENQSSRPSISSPSSPVSS